MGERTFVTRENIGCGSVILIALAVWFVVSQSNDDVEKELRALRGEVAELRRLIEKQPPTAPATTTQPAPEPAPAPAEAETGDAAEEPAVER